MEIDIEKVRNDLLTLNKLIDKYEIIHYNLYNELSNCSFFWNDNNSIVFFENINLEKSDISSVINELKEIDSLYKYLILKYSEFGDKISFKLELKDKILKKIIMYINDISNILNHFENMDFSFDIVIASNLNDDINRLESIKNLLILLMKNIQKYFNAFEEIEKEINLKISKINIEIINENRI